MSRDITIKMPQQKTNLPQFKRKCMRNDVISVAVAGSHDLADG